MPANVRFIAKPWQMETLLQAVREVLALRV
jgi:hypothetical protein